MHSDKSSSSSDECANSCDDSLDDKDFAPSDDDQNGETSDVCIYLHFCGMSYSCKNYYAQFVMLLQ